MRRRRKLTPTIAEVVRQEMQRQGISQAELARRCTVNRSDINKWLTGRQSIRVRSAEQIMAVLGIRVAGPER